MKSLVIVESPAKAKTIAGVLGADFVVRASLGHVRDLPDKELGIDLGTLFTRVAEGSQVVLEEPTVAAIVVQEQKMVAWGQEAQDMFGRVFPRQYCQDRLIERAADDLNLPTVGTDQTQGGFGQHGDFPSVQRIHAVGIAGSNSRLRCSGIESAEREEQQHGSRRRQKYSHRCADHGCSPL